MPPVDAALPPSGEQVQLTYQDQAATVVTVGGGIRTYSAAGRDILDGYPPEAMADGARGQTLIPWPNRVRDGKWTCGGESLQLALTEPDKHNAIHGLVRWVGWHVTDRTRHCAELACVSWPQQGYPWTLEVRVRYELGSDGLTVTQQITNRSRSVAPVAAGAHPYLTVGTASIDRTQLHVPAQAWIDTDHQQIPTTTRPVTGTDYDFREPRLIEATRIDYAFTNLDRDGAGRFTLTLLDPDTGRRTALWVDRNYSHVEVFTGDTLPDATKRRRGLGVEPMTAPPNALATGQALVLLDPGASWSGQWGIRAH